MMIIGIIVLAIVAILVVILMVSQTAHADDIEFLKGMVDKQIFDLFKVLSRRIDDRVSNDLKLEAKIKELEEKIGQLEYQLLG